jgi:hypothetical protein
MYIEFSGDIFAKKISPFGGFACIWHPFAE